MEQSPLEETGRAYLSSRGFTPDTLAKFSLGQVVDPSRLVEGGISRWGAGPLVEAGILRETTWGLKSLFVAETILFAFERDGRVTYVQGRAMRDDASYRWIGPANLGKPLFNADALNLARLGRPIHLCEGVTDTIAATQLGKLAVGVLGASSLTSELAAQFDGMKVILLPDGDRGGELFERNARSIFLTRNTYLQVRRLPPGKDVADLIRNQGKKRRGKV